MKASLFLASSSGDGKGREPGPTTCHIIHFTNLKICHNHLNLLIISSESQLLSTLMCTPPWDYSLHLPLPLPMQMLSPPTIYTPILPPPSHTVKQGSSFNPDTHIWGFYFTNFCTRMSSELRFTLRKTYNSAPLLFLLLLAGPGTPSALGTGSGRAKAGLEGHVRAAAEGRIRSGVKESAGDDASVDGIAGARFEARRVRAGPEAREVGEREDPGTVTSLGSMLTVGEGGLWEPRSSSRCVPMPAGMALCQNIGYDTMRMPNLLGHESLAEAVQQSASWLPLLARECHPDARVFLCSLFAPICLDR